MGLLADSISVFQDNKAKRGFRSLLQSEVRFPFHKSIKAVLADQYLMYVLFPCPKASLGLHYTSLMGSQKLSRVNLGKYLEGRPPKKPKIGTRWQEMTDHLWASVPLKTYELPSVTWQNFTKPQKLGTVFERKAKKQRKSRQIRSALLRRVTPIKILWIQQV